MAFRNVRLDHAGLREVLNSREVAEAVTALAEQAATALRADPAVVKHDAPVSVDAYTTDRKAAAVWIKHAGGRGIQAKHGSMTRAAASVGLEVKERPA